MHEFDNETLNARRFVLPPLVKPRPRHLPPTLAENAIACAVLLAVLAASIALLAFGGAA